MWFHSLLALLASRKSGRSRGPHSQPHPARRRTCLVVEHLEDRMLPSNYTAANVSALIADITAANTAGVNTITLTAPTNAPYVLTAVNNITNGCTGLPVIAAKDNLTIVGNGDTIERAGGSSSTPFRLLEVASGGSLSLQNLTLQNGRASQWTNGYSGGAIYNQGTLVLNGVTVQGNVAGPRTLLGAPYSAFGGGIFSSGGSVTLEGGTIIQNNEALGSSQGPRV